MRKIKHAYALGLVTVLAIFVTGGVASANVITAEPSGGITKLSLGRVTFSGRGLMEINISCKMTLRGSISRTINNTRGGSLGFGSIVEGLANECSEGSVVPLVSEGNPWPIDLSETVRLEGAPKLIPLNLTNFQLLLNIGPLSCLYRGTVPATWEGEGTPVTTRLLRLLPNNLSRVSGGALCPSSIELRGTFGVGSSQRLRL